MATHAEKTQNLLHAQLEIRKLSKATQLGEFIRNYFGSQIENRLDITVIGHKNLEQLRGSGAFVVVGPHNGHLDTPLLRIAVEEEYKKLLFYVAAADYWDKAVRSENDSAQNYFRNTILTYLRRVLSPVVARIFPIDRFNSEQSDYDLEQIAQRALNGELAVLFPEGTRSRDGNTPMSQRKFKSGIGQLILLTEGAVPIIPIYLEGNEKLMPPNTNWPELQKNGIPHRVTVHIGEPIDTFSLITKSLADMDAREIRSFRRMTADMIHGYFVGKHEDLNDKKGEVESY